MDFLDSNYFKAFYWAAKELNFTRASEKAGMTQSGISQQINKLENQLNVILFERVNKQVYLTEAGKLLFKYIEQQYDELFKLREIIHNEKIVASGTVKYAMPHSCLMTPHFQMLLKKRQDYPGVQLKVELCPNNEVTSQVLNKEIDFGFITRESQNPALHHERFATEEYILVGSAKLPEPSYKSKDFIQSPFIDYPGMDILFDIWSEYHFSESQKISHDALSIVGSINSLPGVVTMLLEGVGYTILPAHCAEPWLSKGHLQKLSPSKNKVYSDIYIVSLKDNSHPMRVLKVIDSFREMKAAK